MGADLSRYDDWLAFLAALPADVPELRVVVVNGSAVTGGWDEHSDLDVEAWCSGDAATTYAAVLALARERFDVDHVWELPEATWGPTGRQCFVHLQADAADLTRPTLLVDLVVQQLPARLTMDVRRHGVPLVLHDPDGLLHLEDDEAELEAQRRQAVEQTAARRQTAAWLVERAIARGDLAEAVPLHLRFGVEPLVRLLRIQHCPERFDFGLRYLRTDLPAGMAERVEALLPGPELELRSRAAFAWQDEVLRDLT